MTLQCNCKHQFQDERYGQYMRVHNAMKADPKSGEGKFRCTVCKSEKTAKVAV